MEQANADPLQDFLLASEKMLCCLGVVKPAAI
jgi:hypothetical protein